MQTYCSDLLGDFVTLFCWKLSRKPPSTRYPYGFAKFETLGTVTVSLLLIGGALGIGFHSYHLLFQALTETAAAIPSGPVHDILVNVTSVAPHMSSISHSHAHALDPNAAWFAAVSIIAKEWLYRVTKAVADEEKSPVLLANAVHHRSDAYSSIVALIAILGSSWFPAVPLDPLGGARHSFLRLHVSNLTIFNRTPSLLGNPAPGIRHLCRSLGTDHGCWRVDQDTASPNSSIGSPSRAYISVCRRGSLGQARSLPFSDPTSAC
jgi:cation diffusion facilitator family transporter